MRILIVGSGAREHAFAWALAQSPRRPELFVAPGNAGTAALAENVPLAADDVEGLLSWAQAHAIDLTIVGPEVPLVLGIVDLFEAAGLAIVGPTAAAARLEGSKAFAKAFMERHGIPTAAHRTFAAEDLDAAVAYAVAQPGGVVVKASGLAAGKGVRVCPTPEEAEHAVRDVLEAGVYGEAGAEVVIEALMDGEEASVFALTDGERYVLLPSAQDHKRVGDGDTGPNTGGMGAYAPAPVVSPRLLGQVCRTIIEPTLKGMAAEGTPYRGILYVGLMMTTEGPKVVEFNCRLGDPEAQVVLPLVESDLVPVLERLAAHQLGDVSLRVRAGAAACVVLASEGYPGSYPKGVPIEGVAEASNQAGVAVFHAGTGRSGEALVTAGGRVLGVTGFGQDLEEALARAYAAIGQIRFEGMHFRRDIGHRALSGAGPAGA